MSEKVDDDDDDSDEWAVEDLPDLPQAADALGDDEEPRPHQQNDLLTVSNDADDDEGWERKLPSPETTTNDGNPKDDEDGGGDAGGGFPMIIVDMTQLTDGAVHCRFDANSVNDAGAAGRWRRQIESEYEASYARNADLIADGIVIPCGSTVWRPALQRLRRERPGHYFCPVFPPSKK